MYSVASWQRELHNFIGIKSAFIVEGNVSDLYPYSKSSFDAPSGGTPEDLEFLPLQELLARLFEDAAPNAPYRMLYCDPLRGITNPLGTPDANAFVRAVTAQAERLEQENAQLNFSAKQPSFDNNQAVHNSQLVRAALTTRADASLATPGAAVAAPANGTPAQAAAPVQSTSAPATQPTSIACVYNLASRLSSHPADLSPEENAVFMNLYLGAQDAIRGDGEHINALVLICNRAADIPGWMFLDNPNVRSIVIPNPDRDDRSCYIQHAFPDLMAEGREKVRSKFTDVTDSMKILELDELRRMYARGSTAPENITSLVDVYKYGIKENRWADMAEKLADDPEGALRERVKGQDRALEKIVAVLKRSVLGFSGMQHSSGSKPKGVLFLAGPTGTGKTEVVKAVTELLFGDERSYLRFDMSEYSAENADQKLFGAPPGYVGYESGGQLTNAVKANPFSVLLFDEVEKAHPSIMDKFLQILEDGRMTDGQGNTVHFSETLIFFTSNVGISEEILDEFGRTVGRRNIVEPGEPYEQIEAKVAQAMATHFKPEVLNRIGDNLVVFDYISPEASELIVRSQVKKISTNIRQRTNIEVEVSEEAIQWFCEQALTPHVREKGGRGIGNLMESSYLNPLASFVFDNHCESGQHIAVEQAEGSLKFVLKG